MMWKALVRKANPETGACNSSEAMGSTEVRLTLTKPAINSVQTRL